MKDIETILQDTKVEKINVFGYEIIKCKIPEYVYNQKLLKESIYKVFNSKIVLEHYTKYMELDGDAYTTCGLGNNMVTCLDEVNLLIDSISINILNNFYVNYKDRKINYDRMWMNKIFNNCSVTCHRHVHPCCDGTAVFYYNVPKNGAQLIILKHNIDGMVTDDHAKISHYIKVETGDLIIHDRLVPHAVSKHMSDEPRICFVFDFESKANNILSCQYS